MPINDQKPENGMQKNQTKKISNPITEHRRKQPYILYVIKYKINSKDDIIRINTMVVIQPL